MDFVAVLRKVSSSIGLDPPSTSGQLGVSNMPPRLFPSQDHALAVEPQADTVSFEDPAPNSKAACKFLALLRGINTVTELAPSN